MRRFIPGVVLVALLGVVAACHQVASHHSVRGTATDASAVADVGTSAIDVGPSADGATSADAKVTDAPPVAIPNTIARCANADAWSKVVPASLIINEDLLGIWGSGANDVWIVGVTNGQPGVFPSSRAILHYDGSTWSRTEPSAALVGLWGSGSTDVWAVGDLGQVRHYDGNTWSEQQVGTGWLTSIWGVSSDRVWMVNQVGEVYEKTATGWRLLHQISGGDQVSLEGVWASSPTDIWAVGTINRWAQPTKPWHGRVLHFDGSWQLEDTRPDKALWSVVRFKGSVWAAERASGGTLLNKRPSLPWTPHIGAIPAPSALWDTKDGALWAVGIGSDVGYFDGVDWRGLRLLPATDFNAVWGSAEAGMWAVGGFGAIFHCP